AAIWRGPVASKTIYQLLSLTDWKGLDYLIIDMPPGTGDIHLSILENYQLDGLSLDLKKSFKHLAKIRGGDFAAEHNIPFICKIPLEPRLSYNCDNSITLTGIINLPLKGFI
ncbi:unnamed protein product, partial [Rotaria sp. Silwood2]